MLHILDIIVQFTDLIMATAKVQIPSYNRLESGSKQLEAATYPETNALPQVDFGKIASEWVDSLNKVLSSQNYGHLKSLLHAGSCWRDQLGLSWDYHTFDGP